MAEHARGDGDTGVRGAAAAAAPAGLLVAVLGLWLACEPAPKPDCAALCGPGTTCVDGQCLADAPATAPAPDSKAKKKRKKKKRVRRTSSGGAGTPAPAEADADAELELEAEAPKENLPPFVAVDDRKIPQFSSDHTEALDLNGGSERPSEAVLDKHFSRVTPQITDCVITASRYGDVGSGRLAIKLRILPSGKVESVSIKAPAALAVWGIVPCARKAVFDHRFPSYDGPSVGVDFAVDVD